MALSITRRGLFGLVVAALLPKPRVRTVPIRWFDCVRFDPKYVPDGYKTGHWKRYPDYDGRHSYTWKEVR